jgi:hypothetical protein
MRWSLAIAGIGIIAVGCGGESTTSSTGTGAGGSPGSTTATAGATTGGGGQGGSGGAAETSSTSATSTSSATSSASSSSSTGGMGAIFGATCTVDSDCASGLCATFMQKGMHCSVKCTSTADCPPESGGCGGQGVCKPPG